MDDFFDPGWSRRFTGHQPVIEAELASIIDVHGTPIIRQSAQLRMRLALAAPEAKHHIAVLVAAISAGVVPRLRAASDDAALPGLLRGCVQDMQRHGVEDADWAWWAVRTWAHAFALPTSGGTRSETPAPAPSRAAAIAPWRIDAEHSEPAAPMAPPAPHVSRGLMPEWDPTRFTVAPPGHAGAESTPDIGARIAAAPAETFARTVAGPPLPPLDVGPAERPWGDAGELPRRRRWPATIAAVVALPLLLLLGYVGWQATETPAPRPLAPRVVAPDTPRTATATATAEVPTTVTAEAPAAATGPQPPAVASDRQAPAATPTPQPAPVAAPESTPAPAALPDTALGTETPAVASPAPRPATRKADASPAVAAPRGKPTTATGTVASGTLAGPAGCTPSTCGVVVAARAVDGDGGVHRIVVRTDARESLSFSAPYRLQTGTRVRIVAGRVVPLGPAP